MLGAEILKNVRVYLLAFVLSFGMFIYGYDTFVHHIPIEISCWRLRYASSNIAGGVVSQPFFETHFGLVNADGSIKKSKDIQVSSNVVSVLQAGAFFGALGSAPISNWLGRRWTLVILVVIFSIGALLATIAGGSRGISYIYVGRVISGVGIGGITAVSPAYVSECSPKGVRGRTIGVLTIMISIGAMVAYFVNLGVGLHLANSENIWRVPFGLQLVPAGLMFIGLFAVKESPRWLASKGRIQEAISNLAYFRKEPRDSPEIRREMAEIEATVQGEHVARKNVWEEFFGRGKFIRFVIAVVIFFLREWCGEFSVGYYAPQIFSSIGYTGTKNSLLSSGIYGVVKAVSVTITIVFFIESVGRKILLFISAMGLGTMYFIVGAILKTHPIQTVSGHTGTPSSASKAMAAMLYISAFFFAIGVGPVPWIYVSDIFPTRTRHYGLAIGTASQWLFNFSVTKLTPTFVTNLGYNFFFMSAAIDIGGMAVFSIFLPETKGRSLEEMDIIFGAVSHEAREAAIEVQERELVDHGQP